MKNLFFALVLSVVVCTPVLALNIEVEALSDFSTDNPPKTYAVKLVEPVVTQKATVESGSIVEGKIIVTDAQRLKKDATFSFIPITLTTPDGEVLKAQKEHIGKYKKEVDKMKIAKSAALTAGNFAVKGFSTGFTAIEGAFKNEQGNIIKSTAYAVYDNSPLSYVQKGNALEIKKGQHFYINFKTDDE